MPTAFDATPVPTNMPITSEPTPAPTKMPTTSEPTNEELNSFDDFIAVCNESVANVNARVCKKVCGGKFKKSKCKKPNGPKRIQCKFLNAEQCLRAHCSEIQYDNGFFKKCS